MKRSSGVAIVLILLGSALLTIISPAHAIFSFPVPGPVHVGSITASDKTQSGDTPPSRSMVIDESYNGKSFGTLKNEVLVVRLNETDPAQSWRYTGPGSFTITGDTVPASYPAFHDFRVKVRGPGDLVFDRIDSRSGDTVGRFSVHVVIREPKAKGEIITRYPLYDYNTVGFSPGLPDLWQ